MCSSLNWSRFCWFIEWKCVFIQCATSYHNWTLFHLQKKIVIQITDACENADASARGWWRWRGREGERERERERESCLLYTSLHSGLLIIQVQGAVLLFIRYRSHTQTSRKKSRFDSDRNTRMRNTNARFLMYQRNRYDCYYKYFTLDRC